MEILRKKMTSLLKRLFKKSVMTYKNYKKNILLKNTISISLADEKETGETIYTVKDETFETFQLTKVYNNIEGGEITFKLPPIHLKKYDNALVFSSSDFVIVNNQAIWPKRYYAHFTKIIPLDRNLVEFKDEILYVNIPKKNVEIKNGFSLCGVHSTIWAHFLVQYLPKIAYIQKALEDTSDPLTVIIPLYTDPQIREITDSLLKSKKDLKIVELQNDEVAKCEHLYFMENTSIISDHASFITLNDIIIPKFVQEFLKEKFVNNSLLFPSALQGERAPFRKLFIKRTGYRNIKNSEEIEKYFQKEGFEFISPAEYSLAEKRKLFGEAEFIVGPFSSGFTNILFCQPGTKIIAFMNFQRIYELYVSSFADYLQLNFNAISGVDEEPSSIHSSYYIPFENIINIYKKVING